MTIQSHHSIFITLPNLTEWHNYNCIIGLLAGCMRLCYDKHRINGYEKKLGKDYFR